MLIRNLARAALSALLVLPFGVVVGCSDDGGSESADGGQLTGGSAGVGGSGGGVGGTAGQGGASGSSGSGGTAGKAVTPADLERCGLLGRFVIDSAAPEATCEEGAELGDVIEVGVGPDSGALVNVGAYAVPAELGTDCTLSATNCVETMDPDRYTSATLRLAKVGDQVTGTFETRIIENHREQTCDGRTDFTAVPIGACTMRGSFTPTGAPLVTSGQCSYGWPTTPLVISETAAGYTVTWDGEDFDPRPLDENACTLTVTLGYLTSLVHNGVPRAVTLALTLSGDALNGTITDALTGTSDLGETCSATFSFSAMRTARTESEALPRGCTAPLPFICSDRVCETDKGEGCRYCLSDCPCQTGLQCLGDLPGICIRPCSVWTEVTDCPEGERCDFLADTFISESTPGGCFPAGSLGAGERCVENTDCNRGLFCFKDIPIEGDYGVCLTRCSRSTVENEPPCATRCEDAQGSTTAYFGGCLIECDAAIPGSCAAPNTFCYDPYADREGMCTAVPEGGLGAFGAACDFDPDLFLVPRCESGLACQGFNCTAVDVCDGRCTKDCVSDADCAAPLPVCSPLNVCSPAV